MNGKDLDCNGVNQSSAVQCHSVYVMLLLVMSKAVLANVLSE